MKDLYIKKYWEEEDVLIYLHFKNGFAIRQIEVRPEKIIYLNEKKTYENGSMLCDQPIDILDYKNDDIISKQEFELIWKNNGCIY